MHHPVSRWLDKRAQASNLLAIQESDGHDFDEVVPVAAQAGGLRVDHAAGLGEADDVAPFDSRVVCAFVRARRVASASDAPISLPAHACRVTPRLFRRLLLASRIHAHDLPACFFPTIRVIEEKPDTHRASGPGMRLAPRTRGKPWVRSVDVACPPDWPRAHREDRHARTIRVMTSGSSPLTRGKLGLSRAELGGLRLISAHAGKTGTSWSFCRPRPAHPRSRGENQVDGRITCAHSGSSPLTRGKRRSRRVIPTCLGLIPAHAGKTIRLRVPLSSRRAHPRSRGENAMAKGKISAEEGSSPLTRGKPVVVDTHIAGEGLIPAHAGKT